MKKNLSLKKIRQARTRRKLLSVSRRSRLTVFRSNKHIYAQILAMGTGNVLAVASDLELMKTKSGTKTNMANAVGKLIANKATKAKVNRVMFDRGAYTYHGRVKSLAEAARKGGLEF